MKPTKISELLENINRTANKGDIFDLSKLEIDLLMQQLREVYAALDDVRNGQTQQDTSVVQPEVKVNKRVLNPNQNILLDEPAQTKNIKPEVKPVPEIINAAPKIETPLQKETTPVQKPTDKPADTKPPVHETPLLKSSINESVQSVSSINEKLKTPLQEVHHRLSIKPLKDLIDLNKKFTLLNELFKGNTETFALAISHIDQLKSYEQAEAYVKNELGPTHNWDTASQPAKLFAQLIKQKFGVE